MRAPVVVVGVGAALAAGQVDEADLAHRVARLLARALQRKLPPPPAPATSMRFQTVHAGLGDEAVQVHVCQTEVRRAARACMPHQGMLVDSRK